MALIYCEGDCPLADTMAKQAAEILVGEYPNHSWWVECKQGVLIIKHFGITGERIGMLRHTSAFSHDAKVFKQDMVRAAGELLERAGQPRGAYKGDPTKQFETDDGKTQKHWGNRPPMHMRVIH